MKALSGLRVLDLSDSIAGQFCCRMLADFGADVLLVEPPAGSPIRRMPPFDPENSDNGSILFRHLNLGKESIALDRTTVDGWNALMELCQSADAVVVGTDVDRTAIQNHNPACITALVSDFGEGGPYGHWRGSEMIFQALSGMMYNNGTRDRQPLYGVGHRSQYAAGVGLYISILAGLYRRNVVGSGQQVSLEVAFNTCAMAPPATVEYAYSGIEDPRGEQRSPFMVVRCRDGWVSLWIQPHEWAAFCKAIDCPSLILDDRFADPKIRQDNWSQLKELTQEKVCDWTGDQLMDGLLRERLAGAKAYTPLQLWKGMPHLEHRDYWRRVPTAAGERPILGPPFRLSRTPWQINKDAPDLRASSARVRQQAQPRVRTSDTTQMTTSQGPLAGLRILDLTTAWAGPMVGRILAFLGAEVIKVESSARPDVWRMHGNVVNPKRYPGGEPGERPYNRVAQFNSQNHNKLGVSLDAKSASGLATLLQLAAKVDAVICNFTAGTLARMGLGYDVLKQINPRIIVMEMPGFGNSGPLAKAAANGATMEMAAGMCALIGYPGGPPTTTGPVYPDPMGGYNGAAATLTALIHQQATGEGQYIEISQVEAAMQFIGEELLDAIAANKDPVPCGNRVRWAAPHDAYPAAGHDQWVAIAIETDDEWCAFCEIMGTQELLRDARFQTFDARRQHQDDLYPAISAWTSTCSKLDIAERLQRAGIRAAPVNSPADVFASPYLASRKAFVALSHPEAGTHPYMTLPFRFEKTPASQYRSSPCFGADTKRVLREVVGLAEGQIQELADDGAISDQLTAR